MNLKELEILSTQKEPNSFLCCGDLIFFLLSVTTYGVLTLAKDKSPALPSQGRLQAMDEQF